MRRWSAACLTVLAPLAAAQSLPLVHYDVSDGLPASRVNSIYPDGDGALWICTWEGLARFDGSAFSSATTADGLPSPVANTIIEGRDRRLWIGTAAGVAWLDADAPASEPFRSARVVARESDANHVNALLVDSAGSPWCGTASGVWRGRIAAGGVPSFELAAPDVVQWPEAAAARGDELWFGTETHLIQISGGAIRTVALPAGAGTVVSLRTSGARFIVGFDTSLYYYDPDAPGESAWCRVDAPLSSDAVLRSVLVGRDGTLRLGTRTGLLERTESGWKMHREPSGLRDVSIRSMVEDADGRIWIGTWSAGVSCLVSRTIRNWTTASGLPGRAALYLMESKTGEMAVTTTAGAAVIDRDAVETVAGSHAADIGEIGMRIAQDAGGRWWIGTASELRCFPGPRLSMAGGAAFAPNISIPDARVFGAIRADGDGVRYGSFDGAYMSASFDGSAPHREKINIDAEVEGAPRVSMRTRAGDEWIAGLKWIVRRAGGRSQKIEFGSDPAAMEPRCLFEDSRGRVWVGTRFRGAWCCDDPSAGAPRFRSVSSRDGLPSDAVWSIAEDRAGGVWLGTGRGLARLDVDHLAPRTVTSADGLAGDIVYCVVCDAAGRVWAATSGGVSRLDPPMPSRAAAAPKALISAVRVGGRELPVARRGTAAFHAGELPADHHDIEIAFTAPALGMPRSVAFEHRFEGGDTEWRGPSKTGVVRFARLEPGDYQLSVRAVSPDGARGEPATVSFSVAPPVWRTPWFVALCAGAAGGALWLYHRSRVSRLLAMEGLRRRLASDVHDEVGAGLAQIAILTEVVRRDAEGESRARLEEVATIARSLRESMSDIVWSVDPRRDHLVDLVQRVKHVAYNLFADGTARLECIEPADDAERRIALAPDVRRQSLLLMKELLTNVARHACASHVLVEIRASGGMLILRVRDDGRGFDASREFNGQGIPGARRRAAALGGELSIESSAGRGTDVVARIPVGVRPR